MFTRGLAGAAGLLGGSAAAAVQAHPVDLTGIAAVITAAAGAVTVAWTIYQGAKKKKSLDVESAAAIIEIAEELARRRKADDEEG